MNELIVSNGSIKNRIYTLRGVQVMLDSDLAELYQVKTKNLNKAVKRNSERFPSNFMFQLTLGEYELIESQNTTLKRDSLRFQNGTSSHGGRRYLPMVFTEQGVSMLSGVLHNRTAIQISIRIMDAFISMRSFLSTNAHVFARLDNVEQKQIVFEMKTKENFEKVFNALQTEKPKQGIFYAGQVFDAYKFMSDLVRGVKREIVLVDNYVDETVLTLFSKRHHKNRS